MTEAIDNMFLIDTNILVYAFDTTDFKKQQIAQKLLEKCWKREVTYAVSVQNLAEFFVVVTKKVSKPLSIDTTSQIINDIISFSHWKVLHCDTLILKTAIELYKNNKKHFWDSVIVATMFQNSIFHIYTENIKDFRYFRNIQAVNPF